MKISDLIFQEAWRVVESSKLENLQRVCSESPQLLRAVELLKQGF